MGAVSDVMYALQRTVLPKKKGCTPPVIAPHPEFEVYINIYLNLERYLIDKRWQNNK